MRRGLSQQTPWETAILFVSTLRVGHGFLAKDPKAVVSPDSLQRDSQLQSSTEESMSWLRVHLGL